MNAGRLLRAGGRPSAQLHASFRSWHRQTNKHTFEHGSLTYGNLHLRHMGIFQEFRNRLKGEVEKNPELQQSIKELKEKTGDLQSRTKETAGKIYKHVDVVREEAGARARQVSSVLKDKVHEAKETLSAVTSEIKQSVEGMKATTQDQRDKSEEKVAGPDAEAGTSAGPDVKEGAGGERSQKVDTGKTSFYSTFISKVKAVSDSALNQIRATRVAEFAKDGITMVKEELTVSPSKRAKTKAKYSATSSGPKSTRTDLVPVVKKRSLWEQRWDFFKEKAESNRVYKRFKGVKKHPLVVKGQELAEDMRERWETSDSPMVHKIQDLNDSLFGETATAMALKEIRKRDPTFTFPDFLAEVQENAKDVLQAYLKGDIEELRKRCSREVVDRCRAERRAYESQGIFFDNKILHISDVELKDTKLMGNVPIIIVTFQTQQIFCVRDKNGKITQGAKDDILTVYYAWAMQQVSPEEMDEDELFPQWQLREMQQLGVQAII